MNKKNNRSCVVGCGGDDTLYAFPDPEKDLERSVKYFSFQLLLKLPFHKSANT